MFDHCLYFNTTALARVVEREWSAAFKPLGLTPPQGFLLRSVLSRPGLSQHELATALTVARPTATRLLDGLQELGLIERRAAAFDGRHSLVHPTKAALAIEQSLNDASRRVTQAIQKKVGKERFAETVSSIQSVCQALK